MNIERQIFISTAVFIASMFGATASAQTPLTQINREITQTRKSIDSVRTVHSDMMTAQFRKNANYKYISQHSRDICKLNQENDRLINSAVQLIRKRYPGRLVLPTSVVFLQYNNVPGLSTLGERYNNNKRKIHEYERRVSAFQPERQVIKNKCDSIRNAKIDMYQLRLDSLLNRKLELVR